MVTSLSREDGGEKRSKSGLHRCTLDGGTADEMYKMRRQRTELDELLRNIKMFRSTLDMERTMVKRTTR